MGACPRVAVISTHVYFTYVALGRVLGVHGLHRRDVLQLDWCGPCRLYAVVRAV